MQNEIDFNSSLTTIATCVKIQTKSGKNIFLTNLDEDIAHKGDLYLSSPGININTSKSTIDFSANDTEIEGVLSSNFITEEDLKNKLYDNALVSIFLVDYKNLDKDGFILFEGFFGEIAIKNGKFILEVFSKTQLFNKKLGDIYSPYCRACLGDKYCKIDLSKYKQQYQIMEITNNNLLTLKNMDKPDGWYNYGQAIFNQKHIIPIKYNIGKTIKLQSNLHLNLAEINSLELIAGCDKNFTTCHEKFKNILNFRGEPHVKHNFIMN